MSSLGIILIAFGTLYLIKPNIFRRGIWKKTAVTQQVFSPKQYEIYMRVLGAIFIVVGVVLEFISK
jgi:hypothetical protein